ncbi:MAG: hypothetical protein QF410_11135 [Planctomycetota bacterium]|jgi:hypothetical protein|nr:hypothetical protein [Planctomycetota bacterium]
MAKTKTKTKTKTMPRKKAKKPARKKAKKPARKKAKSTPKRTRRSDEEMIADLQAKIAAVKNRAANRELKNSPAMKAAISALRGIDRALDAAAEQGETLLRHALADSRKCLEAHLTRQGFKAPKANLPRGRKPKGA